MMTKGEGLRGFTGEGRRGVERAAREAKEELDLDRAQLVKLFSADSFCKRVEDEDFRCAVRTVLPHIDASQLSNDQFTVRLQKPSFLDAIARIANHLRTHSMEPKAELKSLMHNSATLMDKFERLADLVCSRTSLDTVRQALKPFHGNTRQSAIVAL